MLSIFSLFQGQRGDALFVYDVEVDELYIFGVFQGQLRAPQPWGTLYQATVFAPSLKYLQDYLYTRRFTGKLRLATHTDNPAPPSHMVEVDEIIDHLMCYPLPDDVRESEHNTAQWT